jgi:hypothetical protein
MLLPTLKEKTCAQCGTQFRPFSSTSRVCSPVCASKWVRAENKQDRAQLKARKQALKRIPDLIKEAQTAFNAWVRARDADERCISCGVLLSREAIGGGFDAGHYRSRGSAKHLAFHEDNCHGQCKRCNRYGAGMAVDYRIGLVRRIGLSAVEALEASNTPHKWQRDELIAIRAQYVEKLKELKRSRG